MIPPLRSLFLSVALAATLANASVFTSPTQGMQLDPGTYFNVTWSSVVLDVLNSASGNPNTTVTASDGSEPTGSTTSPTSSTAVSRRRVFRRHAFRRQDADATSSSDPGTPTSSTDSTSPSASLGSTSTDATEASTASASQTAPSAGAMSTAGVSTSDAEFSCRNGMPVNVTAGFQGVPLCSELRLILDTDSADELMVHRAARIVGTASNVDLAAGWVQVLLPHGPASDAYRFSLFVRDGDGAEEYLSAPFTILPSS